MELVHRDQAAVADDALGQPGVGGDQLEGRAGRVLALDGPVEDGGEVLLRRQRLEQPGRDAARELAGVVGGVRGHGQHRAVPRVQRHRRSRRRHRIGVVLALFGAAPGLVQAAAELVLHQPLHVDVDGQVHVVAGHRVPAQIIELPHHLVEGVDLVHPAAGNPAQIVLEYALHPGLADAVVGFVDLGVGLGLVDAGAVDLVLGRGQRADVAEHVRGELPVRVGPEGALLHRHPGEQVGPLAQVDEQIQVDAEGDRDQLEGPVLGVGQPGADLAHLDEVAGLAQQQRQLQQHLLLPGIVEGGVELAAIDHHHPDDLVVDQKPALAVEDAAPGGFLVDAPQHVGGGGGGQVLAAEHLQVPEPGQQGRDQRHGHDSEYPQPETLLIFRVAVDVSHTSARRRRCGQLQAADLVCRGRRQPGGGDAASSKLLILCVVIDVSHRRCEP